jgi:L-lysine 6-transaminase
VSQIILDKGVTVPASEVFPILQANVLVDGFHIVIDLEKSHGTVMVDALTGKEYLDCYAYFATLPIGHKHPGMDDEGFRASLMTAALANPANSDVYCREYAGFVRTFRELAVPDDFPHLFFVAGGAPAVENAMKAAFDWKAQMNRSRGVEGGADKILHFQEGFHGRTGYALSATSTDPVKVADFPAFDWPRISNPKIHHPLDETTAAAAEAASLREIEGAFDRDPDGIAAILIEPIQGEGGDNHFRGEFLRQLHHIADERDALLIFDEVQTGLGGTGSMWAFQHFGITPDIVAFGKKTQVCGIMATSRLDEIPTNVFTVSGRINSTWGGNLVDMDEEGLVENASRVGELFRQGLVELEEEFEAVSNARGRGFLLAFDLPDGETRNEVRTGCWDAGLATLTCGPRSIRFRPSLIFADSDVERALAVLRGVLRN